MYFPVSGVEVSPLLPPAVAFGISFFASMGGVSGAFLLLPFQMSILGYTHPSVSATNQLFNVIASPGGVYRYVKEKRMLWPLAAAVAAGTLPGVFIGAYVRVDWLPEARPFKLFVAAVLLYIGGGLVRGLLRKTPEAAAPPAPAAARPAFAVEVREFTLRGIAYDFQGQSYCCPTAGVFLLGLVVGLVGGAYGLGGGAIIAPLLVSRFGLPVHSISGATLMGSFLTSVAGIVFYVLIAPFYAGISVAPDWRLGLLFGLGGIAGMYCGAYCQKFVPATAIKWALGLVMLAAAARYLLEYFQ